MTKYQTNRERLAKKQKQYQQDNKEALAENNRKYIKKRRDTDLLFRLTCRIRALIGGSIRSGGYTKTSRTHEILGCSYEEYHQHIESQFTDGMSWDRISEISIDHRLPVSAASTEAELLALNHHRNLQPMWAKDNRAKSDSYRQKDLADYFDKYL